METLIYIYLGIAFFMFPACLIKAYEIKGMEKKSNTNKIITALAVSIIWPTLIFAAIIQ